MGYVIKLRSGQYFAGRLKTGALSHPDPAEALVFTGRLMALLACSQGPADFFDGAVILPEGAPAAAEGPPPSPQAQETQGGAPGRDGEGK